MMIATLIVLSVLAYIAGAGFTFGYLDVSYERDSLDMLPGPVVHAIFWPFTMTYVLVGSPIQRIGFALATRQLEQKKIRVEIQKKARIELEQAEGELEELLSDHDDSKRNKARTSVAR